MKALQIWMRVVGSVYVIVALASLPFGSGPGRALPGIPFAEQWPQRIEDYQFLSGLMFGAIGAALLVSAREPHESVSLVWGVIAVEIVRGLLGNAYLMGRGGPAGTYGAFLLVHLVIMASGIAIVRRARYAD